MVEHTDVAARAHRDARVERSLEGPTLGLNTLGQRRLAVPAAVAGDRFHRAEGRAECDAALGHELEDFRSSAVTVLDRNDARLRRATHALCGPRVSDHGPTARGRGFDDQSQFVLREGRTRLAIGPPAVVGVDLDEVGAVADLVAHHAHQIARVRGLGSKRNVESRLESSGPVAAGGDNRAPRDQYVRSGDDARTNRVAHPHVGIAGAFRSEIAERREAGLERPPGVHHGPHRAQSVRLPQHLIVPRRFVVGMQQQMAVRVDQAGKQRRAWQLDDLDVTSCRTAQLGRRPDGLDGRAGH